MQVLLLPVNLAAFAFQCDARNPPSQVTRSYLAFRKFSGSDNIVFVLTQAYFTERRCVSLRELAQDRNG